MEETKKDRIAERIRKNAEAMEKLRKNDQELKKQLQDEQKREKEAWQCSYFKAFDQIMAKYGIREYWGKWNPDRAAERSAEAMRERIHEDRSKNEA